MRFQNCRGFLPAAVNVSLKKTVLCINEQSFDSVLDLSILLLAVQLLLQRIGIGE